MSSKKQRPAATRKRAAVYFRVSSEEQVEGYSLDAQERAARLYCEAHEWQVAQVYRDEGKSARSDDVSKRPAFAQMLEDAELGLFDILVVHKLDRFARNLRVTLDTLDRLNACDVAFVSISENMDFSTPIGKVILATLGAFAQYYSDNLSHETKKGKLERKRQGMYNGLLPFGVKKNDDGLPVPDPENYTGLLLAYKAAAEGKSDREIATLLNEEGYRTTGNRGANPFTKDTTRHILMNRFYLGELTDGEGGWLPGAHHPMLDEALFDAAQQARASNRSNRGAMSVPGTARVYSLSGLAVCGHCGGRLHVQPGKGRPRIYCYQKTQVAPCPQRSTFLDIFESQLDTYLATFHAPDNAVAQVIAALSAAVEHDDEPARRRAQIEQRLGRIKDLYTWGDMDGDAYRIERDRLNGELATLEPAQDFTAMLEAAASFLRDVPHAWAEASQEDRNHLARVLFEEIKLKDREVVAVTPRPEFAPFFLLDCQQEAECSNERKRRDSNPRSQP